MHIELRCILKGIIIYYSDNATRTLCNMQAWTGLWREESPVRGDTRSRSVLNKSNLSIVLQIKIFQKLMIIWISFSIFNLRCKKIFLMHIVSECKHTICKKFKRLLLKKQLLMHSKDFVSPSRHYRAWFPSFHSYQIEQTQLHIIPL